MIGVTEAATRFDALARELTADQLARPVANMPGWSVRDTVVHVASMPGLYLEGLDGERRFAEGHDDLVGMNDDIRSERSEYDAIQSLDGFLRDIATLDERLRSLDPDIAMAFHGRSMVVPSAIAGVAIGEMLMHGLDIASTVDARWAIPRDEAIAVWQAALGLIGAWLDPTTTVDHHATYEVRLRKGPRTRLTIDHGTLLIDSNERPDCVISADPATLLRVVYRRRSPWRAAATGGVVAWGRRPWLAFSFVNRFEPI